MKCTPLLTFMMTIVLGCSQNEAIGDGNEEPVNTFFFDSGGAHHIEGYGAWRVTLDREGRLAIEHQVQNDVQKIEPVTLDAETSGALWELIASAKIRQLGPSERPGVPGEVKYTFRLANEKGGFVVQTWADDLRDQEATLALLARLNQLIEERTEEKPTF